MSNCNFARYGRELLLVMFLAMLTSAYAAVTDFSGKWSGSSPEMGAMYAVLKQDGTTLTGSAGPSESKQFPIKTGKVDADHLTFEVRMGGGTMSFDLTGVGSQLRGTVRLSEDGHTANAGMVLKRLP